METIITLTNIMAALISAKGQFALSVNRRPAFRSCDAYIKDLLKKVMALDFLLSNNQQQQHNCNLYYFP